MAKNQVPITLVLREDVTPDYIACCIARACFSFYALREGEGIALPSNPAITITRENLSQLLFNRGRGLADETWSQYITHKLTIYQPKYIAELCGTSEAAVARWAAGSNAPIPTVQTLIRSIL